jgi:hypothetical protein
LLTESPDQDARFQILLLVIFATSTLFPVDAISSGSISFLTNCNPGGRWEKELVINAGGKPFASTRKYCHCGKPRQIGACFSSKISVECYPAGEYARLATIACSHTHKGKESWEGEGVCDAGKCRKAMMFENE